VFDGNGQAPYTESDPTNPLSAYGRTKLRGEERFLYGTQGNGIVVRTSWLYGKGGKNFVSTMRTLMADREEVRVVDDQRGRPTWTDDLAEAIARLAGLRERARAAGGIYHYANAGETTWHGFASAIRDEIVHRGWPCKAGLIKPIPTSAYPTPARRPPYSVFSTAKVEAALGETPRPWREALAMYLDDA
jgi:dTDP-4-dehydrorhamnose reductase